MPELSPAARRVVDHGEEQIRALLDELRAWLLDLSGDIASSPKDDGTPVTFADHEVDRRIAEHLAEAFPGHGVVSEERETRAPDTEWTWIVDPIDGTSNFTARLPYWCISVALAYQGEPVLGIVDAPVLASRFVAVAGRGAHVESRSTSLDGRSDPARRRQLRVRDEVAWWDRANRHIPVLLTAGTARRTRAAGIRLNARVMGSVALDLALVAAGVGAASVAMVPRVWDVAAGGLLVTEAGGSVVSLRGEPLVPMQPGVEQTTRTAITVAGPDAHYARRFAEQLLAAE